jgi:WhiB family transcriptional regulator, redox-sensing transcriptional regulator
VEPVVTTVSPRPVQRRSGELNDHELLGRVYRQARCATSCLDPDEWFPLTVDVGRAREQAARAIAVCAECPVRAECLELSLRHSFSIGAYGVWGGLVAGERRELRRRRRAGVFSR